MWDFNRGRNDCSMCGKSYPGAEEPDAPPHIRFDHANPVCNTIEVCNDLGDSCHNRLYGGTLGK